MVEQKEEEEEKEGGGGGRGVAQKARSLGTLATCRGHLPADGAQALALVHGCVCVSHVYASIGTNVYACGSGHPPTRIRRRGRRAGVGGGGEKQVLFNVMGTFIGMSERTRRPTYHPLVTQKPSQAPKSHLELRRRRRHWCQWRRRRGSHWFQWRRKRG